MSPMEVAEHIQGVREQAEQEIQARNDFSSFLEIGTALKVSAERESFKAMEYDAVVFIDGQPFRMLFDTSTPNTWIPSRTCLTCCKESGAKKSTSGVPPAITAEAAEPMYERFPDGTWYSGVAQHGDLELGRAEDDTEGLSGLVLPGQRYYQIFVKGDTPLAIRRGGQAGMGCVDKILGLGFSSRVTDPVLSHQQISNRELDTMEKSEGLRLSVIDRLYQEHVALQPVFALDIADDDSRSSDMEIGQYNKNMARALNPNGLFWVSAVGFPDFHWAFNVPRVRINNNEVALPNVPARISSAEPYIALPQDLYKLFRAPQERVPNPCQILSSLPTLSFLTTGASEKRLSNRFSMALSLCPSDYVITKEDGTCEFAIVPTRLPVIVLGTPFLRKFYTVFDIENKRMGFAQKTNHCGDELESESTRKECAAEAAASVGIGAGPVDPSILTKLVTKMKECLDRKSSEPEPFLNKDVVRKDYRRKTFAN